jgi:hypothetical protein
LQRSPLIDRATVAAVLETPAATVAVPAAAPARASEPAPPLAASDDPAAFATKVDAWLTRVDRSGSTPPQPIVTTAPLKALVEEFATEVPSVVTAPVSDQHRYERRGERYMQRLGRRWARNLAMAAAVLVALNVFVAAASYVPARFNSLLQAGSVPALPAVPAPPVQPVTPAAAPAQAPPPPAAASVASSTATTTAESSGDFVVAVGAFTGTARADRLIGWLAEAGFEAHRRRAVAGDQVFHQVLLGPFETRDAAARVLEQLRAGGDYADARIMANRPRQAVAP